MSEYKDSDIMNGAVYDNGMYRCEKCNDELTHYRNANSPNDGYLFGVCGVCNNGKLILLDAPWSLCSPKGLEDYKKMTRRIQKS